jgi:hypothetical protein
MTPDRERHSTSPAEGARVYTRATLRGYDLVVLGVSNRLIWRCPTPRLLAHYNQHVGPRHLDLGPGTGFFLDRCQFPTPKPELTLMDVNRACLAVAARRLQRYDPLIWQADVLSPFDRTGRPYDSIGLNYVLHCLPGPMASKAAVFDNLRPLLAEGGTLFGATLLGEPPARSRSARKLMQFYSNERDSLEGLQRALEARFNRVEVVPIGCAALFVARH